MKYIMNRIRKYNNTFQVLITPHQRFDSGFELMLGAWTDDQLHDYQVKSYDNMEDALKEATSHPDINWNKLILFHKDNHAKLHKIIKDELDAHQFVIHYEPHIMKPDMLKNIMFDRIINYGQRFKLNYNLNDIIGYHIVNPWTKNIREIFTVLKNVDALRIVRYEYESGVIRLIGETDIGTTYEIVLWTSLLHNWAKWTSLHPEISEKQKQLAFNDVTNAQSKIDAVVNIR